MPNIIKNGVSYIPEIPEVPVADGVTIINSEGVLSAVQQNLPLPDGVTITSTDNVWSAVQQEIPNADWQAEEGSEGFILNKPSIDKGTDFDETAVRIGALVTAGSIAGNVASAMYSVAEGAGTQATGKYSHAEGLLTKAVGDSSHAEGNATTATGAASHAEGIGTTAANIAGAHAQGRYNVPGGTFYDVVGYGSSNTNRANLSALTTNGQLILRGSLVIGAENDSTGGVEIPIPTAYVYEYNKPYALTVTLNDSGTITTGWEVIEQEVDTNKYQRPAGTTDGPFTIYDGTTEPSAALGKPGDIYFKHS